MRQSYSNFSSPPPFPPPPPPFPPPPTERDGKVRSGRRHIDKKLPLPPCLLLFFLFLETKGEDVRRRLLALVRTWQLGFFFSSLLPLPLPLFLSLAVKDPYGKKEKGGLGLEVELHGSSDGFLPFFFPSFFPTKGMRIPSLPVFPLLFPFSFPFLF